MIVESPRIFGRKGKFFTLKSKVLKRRKKSGSGKKAKDILKKAADNLLKGVGLRAKEEKAEAEAAIGGETGESLDGSGNNE